MRFALAAATFVLGTATALFSSPAQASRQPVASGIPSGPPAPAEPNWLEATASAPEPFDALAFIRLLLADGQMRDFSIVERSQIPQGLSAYAAVWRVDAAVGAIAAPVAAAWDGREAIIRAAIASERVRCQGPVQATLRSELLAEDSPMLHIATSCGADAGRNANILLLPIRGREIVTITHWSAGGTAGAQAESRIIQAIRDAIAQSHARAH